MRLIQFLMKSSVLVGITAPNFIWVCSLLLLVLPTIAFWALLRWQVRRAKKPLTTAAEGLKKVKIQHPLARGGALLPPPTKRLGVYLHRQSSLGLRGRP